MQWEYRTILFEFQKDGLLGDTFIDDEDIEQTLNEQGLQGWELVNVALIQEGLLAFCKRQLKTAPVKRKSLQEKIPATSMVQPGQDNGVRAAHTTQNLQQHKGLQKQSLERQSSRAISTLEDDAIGNIKIS